MPDSDEKIELGDVEREMIIDLIRDELIIECLTEYFSSSDEDSDDDDSDNDEDD